MCFKIKNPPVKTGGLDLGLKLPIAYL